MNFQHESTTPKNFFTEIVSSISAINFTKNEKYLASRDFLAVKIWDLAMANKPVSVVPVNEGLKSKLCEMYENEQIFERFSLSSNSDSKHFMTGDFNSLFHVVDVEGVTTYRHLEQQPVRTQLQPAHHLQADLEQDRDPRPHGLR